jgi:hypothetical protein
MPPPLLLRPEEELLDWEPDEPDGMDAPEDPLRPDEDEDGIEDELPLEPDDPLGIDEGDDGEGMEEEDCWLGQPPIRNADTALTAVICVATTSSRLRA